MSKKQEFIVEAAGSIFNGSHHTNFSLAIDLELSKVENVIVGFSLFANELIDKLIIKDALTKNRITIERHEKFHSSVRKGKLRYRSIISKYDDKQWRLLINKNDLDCIISWYLRGFVDEVYRHGVLDIECEEKNMLMFATK